MKLILVRHGQSVWNLENKFTGWTDVELSEQGISEAKRAGEVLKELGYEFDIAYTSVLKRAKDTLKYIMDELQQDIEVNESWMLNERCYGALQGLNKDEMRKMYGEKQVELWRRSVDVRPPALSKDDDRYPGNDELYKDLKEEDIPLTESLDDTIKRVVKYYEETIVPELKSNKRIIIVAHGNSLRALMKYLDNMTDSEVVGLEIKTGNPICYELDAELKPIRHYYLVD